MFRAGWQYFQASYLIYSIERIKCLTVNMLRYYPHSMKRMRKTMQNLKLGMS